MVYEFSRICLIHIHICVILLEHIVHLRCIVILVRSKYAKIPLKLMKNMIMSIIFKFACLSSGREI